MQIHQLPIEGMTVAQALLAVLIPIGMFASTLATLFLKRHFRFIDRLEKRLEEGTKLDAEISVELRLGREQRAADAERIKDLEASLGNKIDDHRSSEMAARVGALAAVVERSTSLVDEEEAAAGSGARSSASGTRQAAGPAGESRRGRRSSSGA